MSVKPIQVEDWLLRCCSLWGKDWLVLTAGDFASGKFNAMTVGWGSFGRMWNKPFAQVVVRPTRYTFEFMEQYDTFTLCAFPMQYHDALNLLGTRSGRDGDKIAAAGLTPVAASSVAAPTFAEAELVVECRKQYWDDMDPSRFIADDIARHYSLKDYHRIYFGEVLAVLGTEKYQAA